MDADFALSEQDVLIAVIGATGSGKSTFISALVEEDIGISHSLISATATCRVYSFRQSGGNLVTLIDTPGFNDTGLEESEVLRNIAFMLTRTYHRGIRLSGIIYTHRITDVRVGGSGKRMMKLVRNICGEEAFPRVILATTMWQALDTDRTAYAQAVNNEIELQSTEYFWGAMCDGGSKLMRWDGSRKSATAMVDFLSQLQAQKGKVTLQIQKEMVDLHKVLNDTMAGCTVNNRITELTRKLHREMNEADLTIEEPKWHQDTQTRDLETVRGELKWQICEAEKAQDALKVNYDILSRQKIGECEELLGKLDRELVKKEHEAAQIEWEEPLDNDGSLNELEYNKERLKLLDEQVENLRSLSQTAELEQVLEYRERVKECYLEFCKQYENRQMAQGLRSTELMSLRGEATQLDKMQMALRGFVFLAGLGLTVAGAITANPPLITGGISLASSSVSSMARGR
ncbi:P-loop containing nucleoside triphosphate hydrolase protein [Penicillium maclennaniae]|uniref:P-loop containing nucleoside triphosphate hydrolase protein n=1 Tax=Penicillium maclennaniae TaxID=1343394 RepID=UPI00254128CD|nr:P-loop containing nucleoside triphosphate hydrolase protein [Penicillium maclennaniae]KAJ5678495.1 P-loop containing nucleoside triphosphate hydrolase protein [Penicillium maclennaniae]